jgi:hypothetical protein
LLQPGFWLGWYLAWTHELNVNLIDRTSVLTLFRTTRYCAIATLMNELFGRELVPVGSWPELHKANERRSESYRAHDDIHT